MGVLHYVCASVCCMLYAVGCMLLCVLCVLWWALRRHLVTVQGCSCTSIECRTGVITIIIMTVAYVHDVVQSTLVALGFAVALVGAEWHCRTGVVWPDRWYRPSYRNTVAWAS